ncbi:MAG TPA: hypothetical protein VKA01_14445 [Vicinamibacteria bacterium]|nr:hypothetical protein [Vicinamibacteria bacterium]
MRPKRSFRVKGIPALALAFAASLASAQSPGSDECGTPSVLRQPVRDSATSGNGVRTHGRSPGPVPRAAGPAPLVASPAELPAAGVGAPPVTPTDSQESPPPPSPPPPAVPGIPKADENNDDTGRPRVAAIQAKGDVPEERLLDVGVEIFQPVADAGQQEKLIRVGVAPEVRRSEARYMAFHLRKTLESTGNWGAVRVVPGPGEGLDVLVSAAIVESNGKRLALDVEAHDARGRRWLRERYRGEADTSAYRGETGTRTEAFQEVYNRIANDLLHARDEHDTAELTTVRRVATLRFAAQLAPDAFTPYIKPGKNGRFELLRSPAEDDPMMRRIASIRERDMMFVDTLNDYYLGFYDRMSGPYSDWRKHSYDEQAALDRINRESRLKKFLGGAAVLAGLFMPRDSRGSDMAGDVAIIGGTLALQAGFEQAKQKGMHETALKELANAFESDTTPLLVEVEGQQHELSGSAEAQFVAWRELLHQIFSVETVPDDPNRVVAAPPSS